MHFCIHPTAEEPREVLGIVNARFADEIPEASEEFETDAVPVLRNIDSSSEVTKTRVHVLPVHCELEEPGHMIDPGCLPHKVRGLVQVQVAGDIDRGVFSAVAETTWRSNPVLASAMTTIAIGLV